VSRPLGLSLRPCAGLGELRFDHHADDPLQPHVGFRGVRLRGSEQCGGQAQTDRRDFARQIEARLLQPERSYSERSRFATRRSSDDPSMQL
jgi:hypothetical protein